MPVESALPESLRGLLQPGAYPHPVTAVTLIETQLSWVLLAGDRAYKIKRPVVYPFVDQSRLDDRRRLCHEELRLNRRFVPRIYLEVCAITTSAGDARIGALLAAEATHREQALRWRAEHGRIRECHADLHLSNVVRIDGQLLPFDCLEFEPAFRWIDVAEDVAFLHADLLGYGEPKFAAVFLDAWLAGSGDYHACMVLPLYTADRALVRAKVVALQASHVHRPGAANAEVLRQRQQGYLLVAERALHPPPACCLMMTGLPGSGKSWLAARLAAELGAVTVRSDLERKRLASPPGGRLYTDTQTAAVYERLEQCAAEVLGGHRTVIVDANHGSRQQRAGLAELCRLMAVPLIVVQCEAPLSLLRQRITARLAAAQDPSEADIPVLERQLELREAITADERLALITARTDHADVIAAVLGELRLLHLPTGGSR